MGTGRWRVAARVARRDARRHRARTGLVVALVGLPVLLASAGSTLILSSTPTPATQVRWLLGQDVQALVHERQGSAAVQDVVGLAGGYTTDDSTAPTLTDHERDLRSLLPSEDRLLRRVDGAAGLAAADRRLPGTTGVTAVEQGLPADLMPVTSGTLHAGADQIALSERRATALGVGTGDQVRLEPDGGDGADLRVTGILAPTAAGPEVVVGWGALPLPETLDAAAWAATPTSWVTWYVVGPTPVTWADVLAVNARGSMVTSRAVVADPPPRSEMPYEAEGWSGSTYSTETVMMAVAIGVLITLEAALLIGPAFAVAARRSQRQLAVLAAVGADRATLRASVLLVGLLTGLVAAVSAAVAGLALAAVIRWVVHLNGHPFALPDLRPSLPLLAGFVAFGVLVTTLAAWLPARRAARVDVVAALGGRRAEAAPSRRVPVVGVLAVVAGVTAAGVGAVLGDARLVLGGAVVLQLGVVAASGGLVVLASRLAPRLGLAGRLALRDAARHRSRTAPAVAAVLAATAGAIAGAVYTSSTAAKSAAEYEPFAATGTVAVGLQQPPGEGGLVELADVLRDTLPVADIEVVHLATPSVDEGPGMSLMARTAPDQECPLWVGDRQPSRAEQLAAARDPRCDLRSHSGQVVWSDSALYTVLVDDGTVLRAVGLPGADRAADALAAGRVVVSSAPDVWPDGTAHLELTSAGPRGEPATLATAELPATAVPLGGMQYGIVLPPSALEPLGLTSQVAGLVAPVTRPPSDPEVAAARAALPATASLAVEQGAPQQPGLTLLVLVGAAALAGVLATGIAVALAAADSVPDLATLSAVGAAPRVRRRFAAGQAGVIAVLGGGLGVLTGVALGWALITMQAALAIDPGWVPVVPWPTVAATLVAVPAAATALGWLTTRSRLPVVRRVAA